MTPTRRLAASVLVALLVLGGCLPALAGSAPGPGRSWVWPLRPQPEVVRPFVPPADAYGPGHRGADLAGAVGQAVLAVAAGRVSFAGQVAGRGVVVVDHGRLRTTYEPVLVAAATGDRTGAGDVVGTLTLTGGHCLPLACLHLGARDGDTYVDPLSLLGDGRVRLLPLEGSPPTPCCPADTDLTSLRATLFHVQVGW